MPVPRPRRRPLAAVALAGGSLAVVLGLAVPATASQAPLSAGLTAQVGGMADARVEAGFPGLGETPTSPTGEPSEPPPEEAPPCDIEEDPESCQEAPPGEEPPEDDPGNPVCEINPTLCGAGDEPPGGGDESPEAPGEPDPAPGPGVDEPPAPGSGPDARGSDDCADGGLGCPPEGATEDRQGAVVPDASSAEPQLPDTGATALLVIAAAGAALILVGGLMALRHYRGKHRG